jgi:thiosulfate reductase cytochrome b subunit
MSAAGDRASTPTPAQPGTNDPVDPRAGEGAGTVPPGVDRSEQVSAPGRAQPVLKPGGARPALKPGGGDSAKPTLASGTAKPTLTPGTSARPALASQSGSKPTLKPLAGSGTKPSLATPGSEKPAARLNTGRGAASAEPAAASPADGSPGSAGARLGNRWVRPALAALAAVVVLAAVVLAAQWLRTLPAVQAWLMDYPGHTELPASAPTGLPAWLGWQHFLNAFFILLIIRSGWKVRTTTRPAAYWTRKSVGILKARNPQKISLDLWLHLSLDALWVLNGLVFIVLLVATGQWMRIVPTSWDIIPNAASSALQYASLDWPLENGWVNYNALQLLAYFTVVFIAAPLAVITGLRMSQAWPKGLEKLNRAYPVEVARAVHVPVMVFFVLFIIVHVVLVFTTGALRNLNHMYASQDTQSWTGFWIFAASLAIMAAAWFLARPAFLSPIASLTGKVSAR